MALRLTPEQRKLKANIKKYNTRIAALYKESQKIGDFTAYDAYTALLQKELGKNALVHQTKYGAIQLSQNPRKYTEDSNSILKLASKVPTLTKIKEKARELSGIEYLNTKEALKVMSDLKGLEGEFSQYYKEYDEQLTDAQMKEQFPELYEEMSGNMPYSDWERFMREFVDHVKELKGDANADSIPLVEYSTV